MSGLRVVGAAWDPAKNRLEPFTPTPEGRALVRAACIEAMRAREKQPEVTTVDNEQTTTADGGGGKTGPAVIAAATPAEAMPCGNCEHWRLVALQEAHRARADEFTLKHQHLEDFKEMRDQVKDLVNMVCSMADRVDQQDVAQAKRAKRKIAKAKAQRKTRRRR